MPDTSLDQSWAFALNSAVGQKLRFGHDIIWTYGPYASIITRQFHPDTFLIMILGNIWIASAYSLCIFSLYKTKNNLSILFISLISFLLIHEEILHTSYILFLSFVLLESPPPWKKKYIFHIFLASTIGLLCLTKLTITYLVVLYIPVISYYLFKKKEYELSFIYIFIPAITIPILWVFSGQNISSLYVYFLSSRDIVTGYPEGMSSNGNLFVKLIYFMFVFYVLFEINLSKTENKIYKTLFLLFFFFSTYKIGFTHAFVLEHIPISATIFSYILYLYFTNGKAKYILMCATLFILYQTLNIRSQGMVFFVGRPLRIGGNALALKDFYPSKQYSFFEKSLAKARNALPLPPIHGSVDTYSVNQSYFLAHSLKTAFRPILQSYSAYTPELIRVNNRHLKEKKPDNIFVKLEPIFFDGHDIANVPLLDDGLSFKTLLSTYQPNAIILPADKMSRPHEFLHLTRRDTSFILNSLRPIKRQIAFRHEKIKVPPTYNPLFVEINFKKSLWGHGLIFLYKMPQLFIKVDLANGTHHTYRFVASMAETGFILSPFIDTTHELLQLHSTPERLSEKKVLSFSIHAQNMDWAWIAPYTITWYELPQRSLKEVSLIAFNLTYAPLKKMNLISSETLIEWFLHTPVFKQVPLLSSFYSRALQREEPSPWAIIKDSTP
jgi:hypothetical protein